MKAGELDIYVEQGTDWSLSLTFTDPNGDPIDLTGCSATGQIRRTYSNASTVATITCTITDATNGRVKLSMSKTTTSGIPVDPASDYKRPVTKYIYDVEMTFADTSVRRMIQGTAEISPEVTR